MRRLRGDLPLVLLFLASLFGGPRITAATNAVTAGGVAGDPLCVPTPAVAHRPGAEPAFSADVRVPCFYPTEIRTMEPTFDFTASNAILLQAWALQDGQPGGAPPVPGVFRSPDGAESWQDVTPPGVATSLDPVFYLDRVTGRAFSVNFAGQAIGACSTVSFTDNEGGFWITTPGACGGFDGQSIGAGPPVTSIPVGYANLVYFCTGSTLGAGDPPATPTCLKSIDGGFTFTPIMFPFPALDEGEDDVFGAWAGSPVVAADGTLYIPKRVEGQPALAISQNEGLTWTLATIASNGSSAAAPRIAIDASGTVYYAWHGGDRLPYLAWSQDEGASWSMPLMIAPPGLRETALARVAVRSPGHVAVAYVGTSLADGEAPFFAFCNPLLQDCVDGEYSGVPWHGYITEIDDVFAEQPLLRTVAVNPPEAPLFRGGCTPDGGCKANLDFIDVHYSPAGEPWAVFVDDCAPARTFPPIFSPDAGPCEDGLGLAVLARLASAPPEFVADLDGDGLLGAADNCPRIANPLQEDDGGIDTTTPDGIGNACQCGDVTGNGIVNGQDAASIKRHGLGLLPNPSFVVPGNCDVTGNNQCNGQDANAVKRAALGEPGPTFGQNCHNALGLAVPPDL